MSTNEKLMKIITALKEGRLFRELVIAMKNSLIVWFYNQFKKAKFSVAGKEYDYFYHRKNQTWINERTIEIPIMWDIVSKNKGKRILEVGNVLSRYFDINYDVVDKYESNTGIKNIDIVEYQPTEKYDLVVSISTLEHVGFDEQPFNPDKVMDALENIKRITNANGEIHITIPSGYNKYLDDLIEAGKIKFTRMYCLKRLSRDNHWQEVPWKEIKHIEYNKKKDWYAQGLVYAVIENRLSTTG